jgi:hypothetical protein
MRRHRRIQREINDLIARVVVASIQWNVGRKIVPADEMDEILPDRLMNSVFGEKPDLGELIDYYRQHGFKERPD